MHPSAGAFYKSRDVDLPGDILCLALSTAGFLIGLSAQTINKSRSVWLSHIWAIDILTHLSLLGNIIISAESLQTQARSIQPS
ncbi:hypothetical protein SeMB42_g04311 [Synchytrium endobioticum]|uniref:Uncharacterized protein n=1 Tax=Synchytrium endobioticum TaxID=286115 RepID=A0A507CNL2_9FUNG|nr:hypothetical protein SeLEV6574_g06448 [Synchytrium endobioticum]TPX44497.1 hypothetical protein SeMB42_g04311 [Synchytrium endobioticum]